MKPADIPDPEVPFAGTAPPHPMRWRLPAGPTEDELLSGYRRVPTSEIVAPATTEGP